MIRVGCNAIMSDSLLYPRVLMILCSAELWWGRTDNVAKNVFVLHGAKTAHGTLALRGDGS